MNLTQPFFFLFLYLTHKVITMNLKRPGYKRKAILLLIPIILMSLNAASKSSEVVIVNSDDWRDVYSSIIYANLQNKTFYFLSSKEQSTTLPQIITKTANIHLIESSRIPVIKGYRSILEGYGFNVTEEKSSDWKTLNLKLAERLNTKRYVIVDDTYGYSAVSVCPYSKLTNSYVLYANKGNLNAVYEFLKEREAEITIYGYVDREVTEKLRELKPETIDMEDRFDNNIEIVKRYMKRKKTDQVTLTNGEFIERGLMECKEPILFIGNSIPPKQTEDYIKESGIRIGVLIGNNLINSAQKLKSSTGINIFLRFGQASGSGGTSTQIKTLDIYPLPRYVTNMTVDLVEYNTIENRLEVVYRNTGEGYVYFKPTIDVLLGGEKIHAVGEEQPQLIPGKETLGRTYDVNLTGYDIVGKKLSVTVFLQFGEGSRSLPNTIEKEYQVNLTKVKDESDMVVESVTYDKDSEEIKVKIRNLGPDSFFRLVVSVTSGGADKKIRGETSFIAKDEYRTQSYDLRLSEEEIAENKEVTVSINYGERRNLLVNQKEFRVRLQITGDMEVEAYLLLLSAAVILILLFIILKPRITKKKSDEKRGLKKI